MLPEVIVQVACAKENNGTTFNANKRVKILILLDFFINLHCLIVNKLNIQSPQYPPRSSGALLFAKV